MVKYDTIKGFHLKRKLGVHVHDKSEVYLNLNY